MVTVFACVLKFSLSLVAPSLLTKCTDWYDGEKKFQRKIGMDAADSKIEEMEGVCECQWMSTDITAAEARLSSPTTLDSVLLQ